MGAALVGDGAVGIWDDTTNTVCVEDERCEFCDCMPTNATITISGWTGFSCKLCSGLYVTTTGTIDGTYDLVNNGLCFFSDAPTISITVTKYSDAACTIVTHTHTFTTIDILIQKTSATVWTAYITMGIPGVFSQGYYVMFYATAATASEACMEDESESNDVLSSTCTNTSLTAPQNQCGGDGSASITFSFDPCIIA